MFWWFVCLCFLEVLCVREWCVPACLDWGLVSVGASFTSV